MSETYRVLEIDYPSLSQLPMETLDCDKGGRGLIGQSLSETPIVSETYRVLEIDHPSALNRESLSKLPMDCYKGVRGSIGQLLSENPIVSETYHVLESSKNFLSV